MAGFTDIADLMKLREFYREFMRSPATSIRDDIFADRDADAMSRRAAEQRPLPDDEGYDLRSPDPLFPRDNPVVNFQSGGSVETEPVMTPYLDYGIYSAPHIHHYQLYHLHQNQYHDQNHIRTNKHKTEHLFTPQQNDENQYNPHFEHIITQHQYNNKNNLVS